MDIFSRLFSRTPNSAGIAKERLQLVLAHDRTDIAPDVLEALKDEIVQVISKHLEIDLEHVEVTISRTANMQHLIANIPLLNTRGSRQHRTATAAQKAK